MEDLIAFVRARLAEQRAALIERPWPGGVQMDGREMGSRNEALNQLANWDTVVRLYEKSGDPDERGVSASVRHERAALAESVLMLAAGFQGHPDYRQEWRP